MKSAAKIRTSGLIKAVNPDVFIELLLQGDKSDIRDYSK